MSAYKLIDAHAMAFPGFLSDNCQASDVELLLPFPPGPPSYQRNWKFIKEINDAFPREDDLEPFRVSARDMPSIFEQLISISNGAERRTWLAPYGPKPMSLAMCLFASLADNCAVYYTQPKFYSPNYSIGSRKTGGYNEVYTYCIKLGGESFYSVPK